MKQKSDRKHLARNEIYTALVLTLIITVNAQGVEFEQHAAHSHGEAQLMIAIEGDQIELSLDSPAANILSFEHAAQNAAEIAAVQGAKQRLLNIENIISFTGNTACTLKNVALNSEIFEAEELQPRQNDESADHADIELEMQIRCEDTSHISEIRVNLFDHFPLLKSIDVNYVGPNGQGAKEINAADPKVIF